MVEVNSNKAGIRTAHSTQKADLFLPKDKNKTKVNGAGKFFKNVLLS